MGFQEKLQNYYAKKYLKKYGDRLTQLQGNVVSTKVTEKSILGLFHKMNVTIIVRPDRSKNIISCTYRKNRWFKKPEFIPISQGNLLLVQGLKADKKKKAKKDSKEGINIINIRNMTTKRDLVPIEGGAPKVQKQIKRLK
ncbi:MAG: hypothetical protein H6Q58_558 [Firmicutes bacterium]|nr:hypothetical protein [Bacillota bacterium]